MQVPRGIDLGTQHGVELVGRQRLDHAVVQHAGGVHDRLHGVLLQQPLHRLAVADIAFDDLDGRIDLPVRLRAAPAGDDQLRDAVFGDEVLCDHTTEPTAAGDEHRAFPHDLLCRRRTGQPRRLDLSPPDAQLRFVRGERSRQHGIVVDVGQHEPSGVLGLRRPHQAPDRLPGQISFAGDESEPLSAFAGDPFLELGKHSRCQCTRRLDDVAVADDVLDNHVLRGLRRQRDGCPLDPEQRVAVNLVARQRDRPHDERLDRGDGLSGGVGERDLHRVAVGAQPHAQLGGTGGVQRHAFPRERQTSAVLREQRGVQRGVEQRRMQAEARGLFRRRHLGVDVVAVPPHRAQPLERGPVLEAHVREPLVSSLDVNAFRTRRPCRRVEVTGRATRRERAGSVLDPRRVVVVARVDRDGPAAAFLAP